MANAKRSQYSGSPVTRFKSLKVRSEDVMSSVKEFFQALDTPIALSCWLMYQHGEHDQLVRKEIDPSSYSDPDLFKLDFASISFLRKCSSLKTGIDTKKAAIDSFRKSEEVCKTTNERFMNLALDPLFKGSNVWLLNATCRKIADILGSYNPEEFFAYGSWGPGATIQISGSNTSSSRKFRYENQITNQLYTVIEKSLTFEYPLWFYDRSRVEGLEIRNCSKILTVPKNSKTDRTIAIEPGMNSWFQKSIGKSIRRKLGRAGYDLNDNTKNTTIAYLGSKDSRSATVDFSSASDTISKLLVRELLPSDWYFIMDISRSHCYSFDKRGTDPKLFEKFSSMGNGFTFELESLIFLAAAMAVTEYLDLDPTYLSVFGDDITIDSRGFDLYRNFTEFLGFTVNKDKSFFGSCPFRESCGSYFYDGVDVKPHFLKETIHDAKSIFRLANGITRLAHRYCNNNGRAIRFLPLHNHLISLIPESIRFRGPLTSGDICITSSFDEAVPTLPRDGFEGYLHSAFVEVPVYLEWDSPAVLLTRLWDGISEDDPLTKSLISLSDMSYGNKIFLRSVTRTRQKRVLVAQWYNLGPWV